MRKILTAFAFVILAFLPSNAVGADDLSNGIKALPPEDQEVVKTLKFSLPEAAPIHTRGLTYIKGTIQATVTGPNHSITDKLEIEMRMLCRSKDMVYSVIWCVRKFDINDRGRHVVNISFSENNDLFAKLHVKRDAKLFDTYTVVRYQKVPIYESPAKGFPGAPKDWWKDEALVYKSK